MQEILHKPIASLDTRSIYNSGHLSFLNHKISLQFERYFEYFFASSQPFYDACSYGSTFKGVFFDEYFSSKIYNLGFINSEIFLQDTLYNFEEKYSLKDTLLNVLPYEQVS